MSVKFPVFKRIVPEIFNFDIPQELLLRVKYHFLLRPAFNIQCNMQYIFYNEIILTFVNKIDYINNKNRLSI